MNSGSVIVSSAPEWATYRIAWSIGQFKEIITQNKDSKLYGPKFKVPCCSDREITCLLEKSLSDNEYTLTINWLYLKHSAIDNNIFHHFAKRHDAFASFSTSYYQGGLRRPEERDDVSRLEIKVKKDDLDSLTDENGVFEPRLDLRMMKIVNQVGTLPRSSPQPESLIAGMNELLKNGSLSDFKIETSDDTLKVHKLILAMRSPVFRVMFESDMIESRNNSLKLDYVDTSVVSNFIHYIYTDRLEVEDFTILIEMVRLADPYQMYALRDLCCNKLLNHINSSNLLTILKLVYTYEVVELRKAALEYVRLNKFLVKEGNLIRLMEETPKMYNDIFGLFLR